MSLHTEAGREALQLAMAQADPSSLAAASALRQRFPAELAAEALSQAQLRARAVTKFGPRATGLFVTSDGLEQATRPSVARWRAQRLVEAGITRVVDLGCGIGSDALACQEAGLEVIAVELDPTTAEHAAANLGVTMEQASTATIPEPGSTATIPGPGEGITMSARVIHGDAIALAPTVLAGAGPETCVMIDPARRTERGRTWNVEAFTPPWSFVLDLLHGGHSTVVKLGPGVPKQLLPDDVETLWVGDGADVVECSLWRIPGAGTAHGAVLLGADGAGVRIDHGQTDALPVGRVGAFLLEPHGAVIRAGALAEAAPGAWLLDSHVAYLASDEPVASPWLTCFEVLDELDASPKRLKAWVRENQVGTLEIKKRAVDVDPATLRRQLHPKGPNSATLVLARTALGTRALVVRRWKG